VTWEWRIQDELEARQGDQRRALLSLLDHRNMRVRLNAAKAVLAIEPERARGVIEAIAKSRHFPEAGHAGMTLKFLDDGSFKPK
jgi:hypothetical protein